MTRKIITIIFTLVLAAAVVSGQTNNVLNTHSETPEVEQLSLDSKFSSNDQAELITTPTAPTKVQQSYDPKLADNQSAVQAPWNVNASSDPKIGLMDQASIKREKPELIKKEADQPIVDKSENVLNYRSLNGPRTQPRAADNPKLINYREMQGPDEQAKEDKKPE